MAAALSKEMEMMENQLNRSKDAASEALALREEAVSLRTLLAKKVCHWSGPVLIYVFKLALNLHL